MTSFDFLPEALLVSFDSISDPGMVLWYLSWSCCFLWNFRIFGATGELRSNAETPKSHAQIARLRTSFTRARPQRLLRDLHHFRDSTTAPTQTARLSFAARRRSPCARRADGKSHAPSISPDARYVNRLLARTTTSDDRARHVHSAVAP